MKRKRGDSMPLRERVNVCFIKLKKKSWMALAVTIAFSTMRKGLPT
jgi:hypothetical protein